MPLSIGDKLGPYEILSSIGEGGMGEVWKARDTRLNRSVAIKISKKEFSERFEREARAVAALNHSRICQLYDVGPNYLVFEYVEGEPLKGPLPLDKTLEYAAQICDALDAAHSKKITHRDLKPANILVTKQGVKLLDFGLAKFEKPVAVAQETMTMALTSQGQILGTLLYMSPEQLQGKEADARSDIFSFGCVLYEMIMGKRAFDGASPASVIAAILERPAPSIADVAPPALDRVLKRCLEKDPDNRWQSARDLKSALEMVQYPASAAESSRYVARPAWWMAATVTAVIIAAITAWAWWRQPVPDLPPPIRFTLAAPPDREFTNPLSGYSISPDGRLLAFTVQKKGASAFTLWLREMDSFTSRELPGTENAIGIFWSPDSKSIAFVADDKLKRIDVAGGVPQNLCDASNFEGGSWSTEGVILFGSTSGGLRRVPAAGGTPEAVTTVSSGEARVGQRSPYFLPDGRAFLYTVPGGSGTVFLSSLNNSSQRVSLVSSDAKAEYAPPRNGHPGYLFWLRDQTLMAQPFDVRARQMKGDPQPVADGVLAGIVTAGRRASYSVSRTGVLAYRTGGVSGFQITWMSRDGKAEVVTGATIDQRTGDPALSPDGRRVALEREIGTNMDVWLYDLTRGVMSRLTFDPGTDWFPIWSPDGRDVVYAAVRNGASGLYRKNASGGGQEELLLGPSQAFLYPSSWSRDGHYLLYGEGAGGGEISVLPLTGDPANRKPIPYVHTQFKESHPQFSPDGKWVAYVSNESGHDEVYIQAFPLPGGKWQVTSSGGTEPRWRADGKELFFLSGTKLWAAGVRTSPGRVEIDPPLDLFVFANYPGPAYHYDVTPDGQRFLLTQPLNVTAGLGPMNVVSDWQAGLKK